MKINKRGFTLVELLVVITIIGILAGLAIPGVTGVLDKAKQIADVSNSKQVGLVLFMIANDENGVYPKGPIDANGNFPTTVSSAQSYTLFNSLIQNDYLKDTKVLATNGCQKYAGSLGASVNLLAENVGWDYVTGLTTSDSSRLPLLISYGVGTGLGDFLAANGANVAVTNVTTSAWKDKGMVVFSLGQSAEFIKFTGPAAAKRFRSLADSNDDPESTGYMRGGPQGGGGS